MTLYSSVALSVCRRLAARSEAKELRCCLFGCLSGYVTRLAVCSSSSRELTILCAVQDDDEDAVGLLRRAAVHARHEAEGGAFD